MPEDAQGKGYYAMLGNRLRGPMPGDKDPAQRRNWVFARSFPELVDLMRKASVPIAAEERAALLGELSAVTGPRRQSQERPAPEAREWDHALGVLAAASPVAAVVFLLVVAWPERRRDALAVRPSAHAATGTPREAALLALPSCLGKQRQDMQARAMWRDSADRRSLVVPLSGARAGREAVFELVLATGALRPMNDDAAWVMDFRRSCAGAAPRSRRVR